MNEKQLDKIIKDLENKKPKDVFSEDTIETIWWTVVEYYNKNDDTGIYKLNNNGTISNESIMWDEHLERMTNWIFESRYINIYDAVEGCENEIFEYYDIEESDIEDLPNYYRFFEAIFAKIDVEVNNVYRGFNEFSSSDRYFYVDKHEKFDESNFFEHSKATFKNILELRKSDLIKLLYKIGDSDYDYESESGSLYIYFKDFVVRFSNHWDKVASCDWSLATDASDFECQLIGEYGGLWWNEDDEELIKKRIKIFKSVGITNIEKIKDILEEFEILDDKGYAYGYCKWEDFEPN